MTKAHELDPQHIESILCAKELLNTSFDLDFHTITRKSFGDYLAKGDYDVSIYALNYTSLYLTFENLIYFENDQLYSKKDHPILNSIVNNVNDTLSIIDALRFTTDDMKQFYPVRSNLKPTIIFKYDVEDKMTVIHIDLYPTIRFNDSTCILTKETIIQYSYESSNFKIIHLDSGECYLNDLLTYKERILKVWNIDKNAVDVDYKGIGELTDMIYI